MTLKQAGIVAIVFVVLRIGADVTARLMGNDPATGIASLALSLIVAHMVVSK